VQRATRGRQARKICGLRLFHPAPWPTRARRSQEKLAQQLGGEISEGIGVWRRFGQQQPCREPREIGDWRLEIGRGGASRLHLVAFVLVLVLVHVHPPSAVRRCCISLRLGGTVPAVATSNTEICAMVETACCIVRATRGAMYVG
jgi:hypothetical protein